MDEQEKAGIGKRIEVKTLFQKVNNVLQLGEKFTKSKEKESYNWKQNMFDIDEAGLVCQCHEKLDPVGSTVRYEMMKLCTGSV